MLTKISVVDTYGISFGSVFREVNQKIHVEFL